MKKVILYIAILAGVGYNVCQGGERAISTHTNQIEKVLSSI